jgi:hypothetical protein
MDSERKRPLGSGAEMPDAFADRPLPLPLRAWCCIAANGRSVPGGDILILSLSGPIGVWEAGALGLDGGADLQRDRGRLYDLHCRSRFDDPVEAKTGRLEQLAILLRGALPPGQ